jgi:glycosyltransferase involved in cell wall biosynthesis
VKVSIVVPAFNEEKLLPGTLRSIAASAEALKARGWDVEIIVCDNNSTDRTAAVAREHGAHVVFEPVNQIARARNAGAAAATGEWLIFVDADSQPSPELFSDAADAMSEGGVIAGGATLKFEKAKPLFWLFTKIWNGISRVKRWVAGSFIFVQAEAFRAIGGFNSEFFVAEEVDLAERLKHFAKKHGKRVIILHRYPLVTSARKAELYGHTGHIKFLWKLLWGRKRVLGSREQCNLWYDGRR